MSGGTDNHMCLVDLGATGLSGAKCERICDLTNIVLNKNTVPRDTSAMNPSGLRISGGEKWAEFSVIREV